MEFAASNDELFPTLIQHWGQAICITTVTAMVRNSGSEPNIGPELRLRKWKRGITGVMTRINFTSLDFNPSVKGYRKSTSIL